MFSFFKSKNPFIEQIIQQKSEKDQHCHLLKNTIEYVNVAIGVLGPPGAGKSSLCNAYYKIKYDTDKLFFEMSTSGVSFTKGIWILKEEERMKIEKNIDKDILDVEEFQIDDIKSWKYVMIISFICSEIIILNRNTRLDDTKKVLNIIKNSLRKMKESNIPKILKKIYIQIDDEDEINEFDNKLNEIGYSKNSIETITILPLYIPSFDKKRLKKVDNNILEIPDYIEDVTNAFNILTSTNSEQSISTFVKYIDNLNLALDGKMNFDTQGIIQDLKDEYNVCYETWENKKKKELLTKNLQDVKDENENFDDFINKQNLDFSFKENLEELTFYGSSDEIDKYYSNFGKDKSFEVPKTIFKDIYDTKIEEKKLLKKEGAEKERKESEIDVCFQKVKNNIQKYFGNLKFYDNIDDKSEHCKMNISTDLKDYKDKKLQELYNYYEERKSEKKNEWNDQIERSKHKQICQAQGSLKCENGCLLNGDYICCGGNCKGKLYWVDGPTRYCICKDCNKVSRLLGLICAGCGAKSLCTPKFTDFIP